VVVAALTVKEKARGRTSHRGRRTRLDSSCHLRDAVGNDGDRGLFDGRFDARRRSV